MEPDLCRSRMLAGKAALDPPANLQEGSKFITRTRDSGTAAAKAAKAVNVSERTLASAVKVTREAPAEVVEAVRRGERVSAPSRPLTLAYARGYVRAMADAMKVITVRVTPGQYAALREEATRRAIQGGGKADASAIIRELVDRWMEEQKPKKSRK